MRRHLLPTVRWSLLVLLTLPACAGLPPVPRTVPEAAALSPAEQEAWLEAVALEGRGRHTAADAVLAPLLERRPLHVSSHLLHQDLRRVGGGGAGLGEAYARIADDLPGDAAAAVLAARVSGRTPEERLVAYQDAAGLAPTAPWPRVALAIARTDRARGLIRESERLRVEGFSEPAQAARAEARAAVDRARLEGERAVALAPGLAAAHAALGHAEAVAAELEDASTAREERRGRGRALTAFDRALTIDPGDPRLRAARAGILLGVGRREDALADLDVAVANAPAQAAMLAARARVLDLLGRREEALDAWEQAADAAPDDPAIRLDYGSAHARLENWEAALREYETGAELYARLGGDAWRAHRRLVTALVQLGISGADRKRLARARASLAAYRESGGPDASWADRMGEVLGAVDPGADGSTVPTARD